MAGAGLTILRRLRSILGSGARVAVTASGLPRVLPDTVESLAIVLRTAAQMGWRIRVEGSCGWSPADAPADLALTTERLRRVTYLNGADLVTTVEAGLTWDEVRAALAEHGAWIAADPPGSGRTVGSVIATGTAGPLRSGFGAVRDHVVGLTLVTGEGRVVRSGGQVVKNVAGFDLAKLATGSFGAFGVVASASFRLQVVPRADTSLVASGVRDSLLAAARQILDAGLAPAALELLSPGVVSRDDWMLAIRLIGSDVQVAEERDAVIRVTDAGLSELAATDAGNLWREVLGAATAGVTTVRLGTLPSALDDALDLTSHHVPDGWLTVSVAPGVVRWSGTASPEHLRLLRHTAAQQEMPVTVERAPWPVREHVGHFGAYRESVGRLVGMLRQTFDPAHVLVTAVRDAA